MGQDVSIIIPDLNSTVISRTLQSLAAQTAGDRIREIVVVGLDEPGQVQETGTVRLIETDGPVCAARARNIGISEAEGPYLVFIDADCVAAPDWLERLLAHHAKGEAVVGGAVTFNYGNYWALCDNVSMFHEFLTDMAPGPRSFLPTLNLSVACQVADEVGPFDESFPRASAEDIDWTLRAAQAGHRLYFEPRAVVEHRPERYSLAKVLNHWHQAGHSMVRVRLRHAHWLNTPRVVRSWPVLLLLSPLVAAGVTAGIFLRHPSLIRYLHTMPVVLLTKMVWCWGAAAEVRTRQTAF